MQSDLGVGGFSLFCHRNGIGGHFEVESCFAELYPRVSDFIEDDVLVNEDSVRNDVVLLQVDNMIVVRTISVCRIRCFSKGLGVLMPAVKLAHGLKWI